MRLSSRLKAIVDMVPPGMKVADIGTDHGYIPVYLSLNGISDYIVATDIKSGSLNKAINEIKKNKLSTKIITRLGSGLKVLNLNEVDIAIIAGMGGILIADILEKDKNIASTIKRFILQPMKASDYLRYYLNKNGYRIIDEDLILENEKYYEIIVAEHGHEIINDNIFYEIGKKLIEKRHPLVKDYIKYKIGKMRRIIDEVSKSHNNISLIENILYKIKKYEVLLNESEMPDNCRND
ncbi:class I SAM-dependent methyltransferase [Thermoanaerobacterium sp. RBIITD]|uniref:tRNA (adenine(22)-N(1))-methyltransferase n=1 Tax=Thermoanaerobacterium sp. RBIITD TaxID=1550240 RepID=UPI000BB7FDF4|nr:class I SAM-dependent methyltransferase [Thermoanaerobacterium sp. RBIITD]SNX54930.1 tRNA (adenine22-N1)-methyltransferase [Thermoanaerobacterium sp. RBIITD]